MSIGVRPAIRTALLCICLLTTFGLVTACVSTGKPPATAVRHRPHPPRQAPETSEAPPAPPPCAQEDYVSSLSVARLALAQGDTRAAGPYLKSLENCSLSETPPARRVVAILHYSGKRVHGRQTALAAMNAEKTAFSDLQPLLAKLAAMNATLQDIQLGDVAVYARPSDAPEGTLDDISGQLDRLQRHVLESTQLLPPLEETRMYLLLVRSCMALRERDCAYLAMENATQSLAAATQSTADQKTLGRLTGMLETTEKDLRAALPYGLHLR
jgi:hypothetical protein